MRGRDEGGVVGGDQEGPGSTTRWVVVSLERDERITQRDRATHPLSDAKLDTEGDPNGAREREGRLAAAVEARGEDEVRLGLTTNGTR